MAIPRLRPVPLKTASGFRWQEQYIIRRFHPRRILLDAALLPWAVYFLWNHEWIGALGTIVFSLGMGYAFTSRVDVRRYSRTLVGRVALLHLHPLNLLLQSAGLTLMFVSLWIHSTEGILASLSLLFFGHMAGWEKVWSEGSSLSVRQ